MGASPVPEAPPTEKRKQRPTAYGTLYGAQTDELRENVERELSAKATQAVSKASGLIAAAIQQAYLRGLQDGFTQGIAAEAESKDERG